MPRRSPAGRGSPETSNVNFAVGIDVPNMVIIPLGADGSIAVLNRGAPAHVLVDMLGFVTANAAGTGQS